MNFVEPALIGGLDAAAPEALGALAFGVIGLGEDGLVEIYNAFESRAAGLTPDRVIGRHFFVDVAPCMNNYLVAERLENEPSLDDIIPYVLTFRMRPTPARLRLLRAPDIRRRYVLIDRG